MAVRLFEDREHASAYLQYRMTPDEIVSSVMCYVKKRIQRPLNLAVDVGCGSGQGTVLLAPYFSTVVGTDISPAQLESARAEQDYYPNVSYRQSPAEDLPLESCTVDLVTAMTSAHWFDRQRFLKEVNRILMPGGCLTLLGYTMDMELEYGGVSDKLNDICKEFYSAVIPFRHPRIGPSSLRKYRELFDSCVYPDKEWHDCVRVRRTLSVDRFIELLKTFSYYQQMKLNDPNDAELLIVDLRTKLLSAMQVSSPETEITMIVKYFYWLACKPHVMY